MAEKIFHLVALYGSAAALFVLWGAIAIEGFKQKHK